jgi:hypothetical protein
VAALVRRLIALAFEAAHRATRVEPEASVEVPTTTDKIVKIICFPENGSWAEPLVPMAGVARDASRVESFEWVGTGKHAAVRTAHDAEGGGWTFGGE